MVKLELLRHGLPLHPLPKWQGRSDTVPHGPILTPQLTDDEAKLAVTNSLRYFAKDFHPILKPEFEEELKKYGHIYMYRFVPEFELKAYPLEEYPAKCKKSAAIMLMIMNNLDKRVAQYPQELITYGGNGQVFSNWAQFWITMRYLANMTEDQTLVMYSGHPLGLFPSPVNSPQVIITNGMVIPNYSSRDDYNKMFALGVTMYGQMTAGSYCYIGPQGIVHGTTLTLMNAGRKYLNKDNLNGTVFVTSGLGGMSGAQAKAAVICGCIGVIAEVDIDVINKRHKQGWVEEVIIDSDVLIRRIREAKANMESTSIAFHGNIVDVWEALVRVYTKTNELLVDLGSDQTSCHNPFNGGYWPVQLTYEEAQLVMKKDSTLFKQIVQESLRRQVSAINKLSSAGMYFYDYGNAFLLEAHRAGAELDTKQVPAGLRFKYPSYMQDIMGDIFSLGFGPFRWICSSCDYNDLKQTDQIAIEVLKKIIHDIDLPANVRNQYEDNIKWIDAAPQHNLVVGSQARILYSDQIGRARLAIAFNAAVREGRLKAPVIISRDHHDVSGTDSPFRETSNVYDGSAFTADMAVQNCIGDAFRGATWVSLHNGGGVGWGEVINGGFGLVLDGSDDTGQQAEMMLSWDVINGVARRAWSGNDFAIDTVRRAMQHDERLLVTIPEH